MKDDTRDGMSIYPYHMGYPHYRLLLSEVNSNQGFMPRRNQRKRRKLTRQKWMRWCRRLTGKLIQMHSKPLP